MTQLPATFQQGVIAPQFQGVSTENDLAAGVQSGFGLITFKGKVWSIKYRGDERQLMRPDGDGPVNSIEVVIVKASPHISKVFYENGYVEGANAPPDCFSTNGITPDVSSAKKQAQTCAACPKNAWGSRITPQGKAGKACSDTKRLAVVPMSDIQNEAFGGPMLLRVPAASLQDMALYSQSMAKMGYPYFAVATRIGFNPAEAYPKFQFSPIRPLTQEEADMVIEHQKSVQVEQILAEATEISPSVEETQPTMSFEQPPQQTAPAPTSPAGPSPEPSPPQQEAIPPTDTMQMGAFGPMTSTDNSQAVQPVDTAAEEPAGTSQQAPTATSAPPAEASPQTSSQTPPMNSGENSGGDAQTATPESSNQKPDEGFEENLDDALSKLLPS